MAVSQQFIENLRFLVWEKAPKKRERWHMLVAEWTGCIPSRARELLWEKGEPAKLFEMEAVAEACHRDLDVLANQRLLKPDEILAHNIDYLFDGLDHGSKGDFARAIGVNMSTISRWRGGKTDPSRANLDKLREQFALDVGTDLESHPLFLSPTPVSLAQRRDWLKRRIDRLSAQAINKMFPALSVLVGGEHADD